MAIIKQCFNCLYGISNNKSVLAIFETDDLDKFNEFDSEETEKAMSNDGIEKIA